MTVGNHSNLAPSLGQEPYHEAGYGTATPYTMTPTEASRYAATTTITQLCNEPTPCCIISLVIVPLIGAIGLITLGTSEGKLTGNYGWSYLGFGIIGFELIAGLTSVCCHLFKSHCKAHHSTEETISV